MRRQAKEVFGLLTWMGPLIAALVLSSCSSAPSNGPPFGPTVSERVLLVGIVDRLEEHGSFRFRWSGEVVDPVAGFEDDSRVAPLSTRPAEGQARSDLSRWWSMRYPPDTAVSDFRIVGWSELARYEQATASNSHDLERTCRVPFQRFTTDQCLLFFGDFSGLWRSNDLNRTLSELARQEVADRDTPLQFKLVQSTSAGSTTGPTGTTSGARTFRYRANLPSSFGGGNDWIEYEVGVDRTLHVVRRTYARTSQPGLPSVATTELYGFGDPVVLPLDPRPGER